MAGWQQQQVNPNDDRRRRDLSLSTAAAWLPPPPAAIAVAIVYLDHIQVGQSGLEPETKLKKAKFTTEPYKNSPH